ncbi:MAG: cache domain-containing protein [Candidatus Aminicenantia bacterium]
MKTEQKKYEALKRNFIILFLALSLIPLFTVSLISYFSFKNSLHNTISTHLFEIAKNKGIALQKWLFERHADAEVFARSPTVVESVVAIKNLKNNLITKEKYSSIAKKYLQLVKNRYDCYDEIFILDKNGQMLITTEKMENIEVNRDYFREALNGRTFNSNIYLSPLTHRPTMVVSTPIRNSKEEIIGVLVERIKLDAINKLMKDIEIGKTGESYLINKQGYFLTESKFESGYTLKKKISTKGTQECKEGRSGVGEYIDYRGKKVLGAYFWIPEMEWSLMVEQDSSEAFQKIQHLRNIIFVIGLITIIVIVASTLLVSGKIVKILKRYDQEFKEQQQQVMKSEKLAAMGQLAASVAHEINNPLGGISNCLKLISTKINKPNPKPKDLKDSIKYLRTSEQELNRCIGIVRNFLVFSRRPKLKSALTNINTVILELIALIAPQATVQNIKISKELESDLPQLMADAQQLHQALMNIILNSLEAMPQGGKLKIRSGYDQRDEAIKIEITDTGYGIPEENLPYLFEPFFSSKPTGKGTGLGLSIVYEIIDEHNGSIEVESEINKGTTFIIKLPIHKEI